MVRWSEVGDDAGSMGAGHVARVSSATEIRFGAHASAEQDVGDGQG